MKISLEFHDFSVLRSQMSQLLTLKEHYPNLKVSMFTIPYDYELEMSSVSLQRDKALKMVKDNLDWIRLYPHGLMHIPNEFQNCDRWTMKLSLQAIDEAFKKDGLPYSKGFCAPYWLWNQDVIDILDEQGWFGAIDRNQPEMLKTKKFYEYNYSIDEPFWKDKGTETLKLHGHMTLPSANNLGDNMLNLMKMPHDAEFVYIDELLEDK